MPARIDPDSGALLDVDHERRYTFAEIRRIKPPCPQCGTPISVPGVKVDSLEGPGPTDLYMIGQHSFNCRCTWPRP